MLHKYTCLITNMFTKQATRTYTHAHSHNQAVRNFCIRYPYPPNLISEVKDQETGVVLENDRERRRHR